jgi:serine/threonine protein kinase
MHPAFDVVTLSLEGPMTISPRNEPPKKTTEDPNPPLRHVGRYELVGLLGQGGMASVHIGRLAGLAGFEKLVAVKIIHPHLVSEREFVSMFLDEARIAACIQHPNVAAITEMGEDEGQLYMVGELVQGESLRNVMRRLREERAGLPHAVSAYVVAKMCDGLHAAHELADGAGRPCGIVHRDVSPQNVLVSYSGHVKLIDFGVAQARDRITHTQSGTIKGKIGYLSPEQLRGIPLDRRSDVFSAGVVLYQLLTGTHPFPGDSDIQRLDRIARAEFRPPRELEPSVSPHLERVVITALAREPSDRFPSAAAMAQAIGEANRAAGERVGSTRLSALMKWLFSKDIAERAGSLERHRERCASGSSSSPGRLADSQTRERWIATGSGQEARTRGASWGRRKMAIAGSGALVLAAVFATLTLLSPAGAGPGNAGPPAPVREEASVGAVPAPEIPEDRPGDVAFEFSLSPEGARLLLDGKPLAAGIQRLLVPRDGREYVVTAQAPGHRADTVVVIADGDRLIDIHLTAVPEGDGSLSPGAPQPAPGRNAKAARRKARRRTPAESAWASNPF